MRGRQYLADHLFYPAPSVMWMRAGKANPTLLGRSVGQPALIARPHHDARLSKPAARAFAMSP